MSICTISQVKTRLGIATGQTQHDAVLSQIVAGVSGMFIGRMGCNRPLEEIALTEMFDVLLSGARSIYLSVWPVVSVSSIKERWVQSAWADADELTDGRDYDLDSTNGIMTRIATCWPNDIQSVRAVYTAGYVPPSASEVAGFELSAGQVLMPAEIVEAAIQQVVHVFQRRENPAQGGGSVRDANAYYPAMLGAGELLPGVVAVLRSARYRRAM